MKIEYIKYGILFLIVMGCSKNVLNEEIVSGITADAYYVDEKGINDALVAAYAGLKDFYGQEAGIAMTCAGTDLYGAGRANRFWNLHNYDATLNSSDTYLAVAWKSFYKVINIANTVLNRAPDVVENQTELQRITAEARFLRAYVYFQLVQIWGDVHLTTEETTTAEIEASRTPVNEIYTSLIIPDLEYAISNLPITSELGKGKATQPAAKAIMARVAMVLEDWATAETLTKSIINDYSFSLTDTYAELWDMNNQENSEVIWSIQFTQSQLVSGDNWSNRFFTPWYTKHPGLINNPQDGRTGVALKQTPYFYSLWDKTKDRRFSEGLKSVWRVQNESTAMGLKIGDTALYYSIDVLTDQYKASKPYVIYDLDDLIADDSAWPQPTKARDESRQDLGDKQSRDVIIARLADMYLLLAEAQFHQNRISEAVETINVLRHKRAIDGKENEMEITAADLTLDFILDEHGRELFAEGQRWFVLKRLGLLVERVRLYNHYGGQNHIQDYHMVRPIPLEQIERTENDYPQNPNYN